MSDQDVLRISVNGIDVGSLPAGTYDQIVTEVRRNKWLYVYQGFNWIAAGFRFVVRLISTLAIVAVLIGMAVVLFSPDATADIWANLMKATPQQVATGFRTMAVGMTFFTILAGLISLGLSSYRYGAFDVFEREINRRVRELLEVPTEGYLTVRADERFLRSSQACASVDA